MRASSSPGALDGGGSWGASWSPWGGRGSSAGPTEGGALWAGPWFPLASVALSALIAIPLAVLFARSVFPGRRVLGAVVALPAVLPPLVGVIAFLFLYGESGFFARLVQ